LPQTQEYFQLMRPIPHGRERNQAFGLQLFQHRTAFYMLHFSAWPPPVEEFAQGVCQFGKRERWEVPYDIAHQLKIGWDECASKEIAIVADVRVHVLIPPHLPYNGAGNMFRRKITVLIKPQSFRPQGFKSRLSIHTVSAFSSNFLIGYILRLKSYRGHAGEESMLESTAEEEFQCIVITYVTGFLKCSGPMVQNP
jgi:hypothetical protein